MKIKLIIIMFCLVSFLGTGQTYYDSTYITGHNNVFATNVIALGDTGCVFVTYIRDTITTRQDMGFIRLDKQGNEVAKKSFNLNNRDLAGFTIGRNHFIEATPCSYFVSGATYTNTHNNTLLVMEKINRLTLDTMKVAIYNDPNHSFYANNFIKLHNNKYFLIGNKFTTAQGYPLILMLDSNLAITNSISITSDPNYTNYTAFLNPITKKILLTGVRIVGQYPIKFVEIDTLGVITRTATSSLSTFSTNFANIQFSSIDSTYVGIGLRKTGLYGNEELQKLSIFKYDKNFNLLWLKMYGENAILNTLAAAVINPDGSIIAVGNYSKLTSLPLMNADQNGIIMKVDKDGHFIWMNEYNHYGPGDYREGLYGVSASKDGGYVMCGSVMNLPNAKAWAVKTDDYGCVLSGCLSTTLSVDSIKITPPAPVDTSQVRVKELQSKTFDLKIYPNPVIDFLNIELSKSERFENLELIFINVEGQEVKKLNINRNEKIDVSDLKSGLYLIVLKQEGEVIFTTKIIKE